MFPRRSHLPVSSAGEEESFNWELLGSRGRGVMLFSAKRIDWEESSSEDGGGAWPGDSPRRVRSARSAAAWSGQRSRSFSRSPIIRYDPEPGSWIDVDDAAPVHLVEPERRQLRAMVSTERSRAAVAEEERQEAERRLALVEQELRVWRTVELPKAQARCAPQARFCLADFALRTSSSAEMWWC